MHIYVRRGGPNYQKGLAKMRALGEEIGIPIEVSIPHTATYKPGYVNDNYFKILLLSIKAGKRKGKNYSEFF